MVRAVEVPILLLLALSSVEGCLLPHERDHSQGVRSIRQRQTPVVPIGNQLPVAANTTDRFKGGDVAPRGLGSQGPATTITSSLNMVEMRSAVQGLVKEFGIQMFDLPEKTHDDATMFGAKVADQTCDEAYRVFLVSGIHARERGGPDNLIYFISDLLWAKREGTGLTYGDTTYNNSQVLTALSTGIIFMPVLNPDGVLYDQMTDSCWRKNRNPDGPVDLNRNFDFLWDFNQHFAPGVGPASEDPDAEDYHGTALFSEPETRNVKSVFDKYAKINWFLDMHSYSDAVLYPWGDDENQDSDPTKSFMNSTFDGKRGVLGTDEFDYRSYIDSTDWNHAVETASRIADGMMSGGSGRFIDVVQSANFYPTSGTTNDYAYSRALVDGSLTKVNGFAVEFGLYNEEASCPFYPNETFFNDNIREMGAGLMEFLLSAADIGVGEEAKCGEQQDPPDDKPGAASLAGSSAPLAIVVMAVVMAIITS